jgi:hypothetical protein
VCGRLIPGAITGITGIGSRLASRGVRVAIGGRCHELHDVLIVYGLLNEVPNVSASPSSDSTDGQMSRRSVDRLRDVELVGSDGDVGQRDPHDNVEAVEAIDLFEADRLDVGQGVGLGVHPEVGKQPVASIAGRRDVELPVGEVGGDHHALALEAMETE